MALTWSGVPERRRATRSAKKSVGAGAADAAGDAVRRLADGRRDAQAVAAGGAVGATSCGPRRASGAQPVGVSGALANRGRGRSPLSRRPRASHAPTANEMSPARAFDALHEVGVEARCGDGLVAGDPDRWIGPHDGVGVGEPARPRRAQGGVHQQPGPVGERDRQPDGDERAGERAAAGAQGLE